MVESGSRHEIFPSSLFRSNHHHPNSVNGSVRGFSSAVDGRGVQERYLVDRIRMPTRLTSLSRTNRSSSRPPPPPVLSRRSTTVPIDLNDLNEDWEPSSDEPVLDLPQVKLAIQELTEDLKLKGREVSGKTM